MSDLPRVPIAKPAVGDEEWEATRACFESGWLTSGPRVAAFEAAFAAHHGAAHAVATTSCTTALHLALAALDIKPGDEVLVPSFTWVATANAVRYVGATPVLCDVQEATYLLDLDDAVARRTERTRAVMPVHLFGLCVDVAEVRAKLPGLVVVEDAACAVGALDWRRKEAVGEAACFSFHPRKVITTGEGGMVLAPSEAAAERLQRLRNHGASVSEEARHHGGQPWLLPDFDETGFNFRMTDMQAAVGSTQLNKLAGFLEERDRLAARYDEALSSLSWLRLPPRGGQGRHGWQAYVCFVDDSAPASRNAVLTALLEAGISGRPGTHAIHELGAYRDGAPELPGAARCAARTLALPLFQGMADDVVGRVADVLQSLEA